ncbi:MAG TPA: DUF3310 domain-containing protein [Mesotoga sp.]|nr:DUF3310 domain-containing protein [Mesotoga sp.]
MEPTSLPEGVDHPAHYNQHASGIECIDVVEGFNFNRGNAIKYIWRAGEKGGTIRAEIQDLEKARWYIAREIERLQREADRIPGGDHGRTTIDVESGDDGSTPSASPSTGFGSDHL